MIGVEELIEFRSFRIFDVDDAEAIFPGRDVGVSPREINIAGVAEREFGVCDWLGMREVGGVEYFEANPVNNERVAELHGDAARFVERRRTYGRSDFWRQRILQIDDDQIFFGENVSVIPNDGDSPRASEHAVGIE